MMGKCLNLVKSSILRIMSVYNTQVTWEHNLVYDGKVSEMISKEQHAVNETAGEPQAASEDISTYDGKVSEASKEQHTMNLLVGEPQDASEHILAYDGEVSETSNKHDVDESVLYLVATPEPPTLPPFDETEVHPVCSELDKCCIKSLSDEIVQLSGQIWEMKRDHNQEILKLKNELLLSRNEVAALQLQLQIMSDQLAAALGEQVAENDPMLE